MSEPCSCKDIIDTSVDSAAKVAALRVSPSIVTVITHDVPDNIIPHSRTPMSVFRIKGTCVCAGSGVVIESHAADDNPATYFTTVVCLAVLFKRTHIQPHHIQVDVRLFDGRLYKAELLVCDFHYNIAAVRIQSDTPLQPASLRNLSDVTSLQPEGERPFKLQRNSDINPFKVQFGTNILVVTRSHTARYEIIVSTGVFRPASPEESRQEFFFVKGSEVKCRGGGAVINYHGEVIGICSSNASFFPSNLVSRWWDHCTSFKEFRRPCLGMKVASLYEARTEFLERFARKFPKIVTGLVVTKVEENSPAHQAGIQRNDVLIKCDGNVLQNKLEFCEKVWDHDGGVIGLDVLKARNGGKLNLNLMCGEPAQDKLSGGFPIGATSGIIMPLLEHTRAYL